MPYIFPKRTLKKQDVLDPVELNEDVIPAAEVYSGKLNAHNIDQTSSLTLARDGVSETAFYNYYHEVATADPDLGSPSSYSAPSRSATTTEHTLSNDTEWDSITSMSLTATTGLSTFWIVGQLQYFWMGYLIVTPTRNQHFWSRAGFSGSGPYHACRVQFAIRVDGNVLTQTITGEFDPYQQGIFSLRPTTTRGGSTRLPGNTHPWSDQPTAIGAEALPVRMGTMLRVQPGTHTVELVGRRIPLVTQDGFDGTHTGSYSSLEPNVIAVFNRQLFALDLPTYPATDTVSAVVDVPAYDSEQVVSASSLGTDRVDKIAAELNDIKEGAVGRGALANYHLPSAVIAKNQHRITGGKASLSSAYPGWNATTTFNLSPSGTGWYLLQDASGDQLKTDNTADFDRTGNSIFIIMANVQVVSLRGLGLSNDIAPCQFGALTLGYRTSGGTDTALLPSEVYLNHFASTLRFSSGYDSSGVREEKNVSENVDIPLFAIVKSNQLPDDVDYFAVYGSTTENPATGQQAEMTTKRGNILVIQLKV